MGRHNEPSENKSHKNLSGYNTSLHCTSVILYPVRLSSISGATIFFVEWISASAKALSVYNFVSYILVRGMYTIISVFSKIIVNIVRQFQKHLFLHYILYHLSLLVYSILLYIICNTFCNCRYIFFLSFFFLL